MFQVIGLLHTWKNEVLIFQCLRNAYLILKHTGLWLNPTTEQYSNIGYIPF